MERIRGSEEDFRISRPRDDRNEPLDLPDIQWSIEELRSHGDGDE
jgi:hypothetical protein